MTMLLLSTQDEWTTGRFLQGISCFREDVWKLSTKIKKNIFIPEAKWISERCKKQNKTPSSGLLMSYTYVKIARSLTFFFYFQKILVCYISYVLIRFCAGKSLSQYSLLNRSRFTAFSRSSDPLSIFHSRSILPCTYNPNKHIIWKFAV